MNAPSLAELTYRVRSYMNSKQGQQYPDSRPYVSPSGRMLLGTWILGQDYRTKSPLYGAYPARYPDRVQALFPEWDVLPYPDGDDTPADEHETDLRRTCVLHAFSGSLAPGPYVRVDQHRKRQSDLCVDITTGLPEAWRRRPRFELVIADPPYSDADAAKYEVPMVHRPKALVALAEVTKPGGHLVWLDVQVPMFRKADWHWWGAVTIIRSTNHRVRIMSCFKRV